MEGMHSGGVGLSGVGYTYFKTPTIVGNIEDQNQGDPMLGNILYSISDGNGYISATSLQRAGLTKTDASKIMGKKDRMGTINELVQALRENGYTEEHPLKVKYLNEFGSSAMVHLWFEASTINYTRPVAVDTLDRRQSLHVNLGSKHYRIPKTREQGEAELKKLAQSPYVHIEDAFFYISGTYKNGNPFEFWYECGKSETKESADPNYEFFEAVLLDPQISSIREASSYHIHPLGIATQEDALLLAFPSTADYKSSVERAYYLRNRRIESLDDRIMTPYGKVVIIPLVGEIRAGYTPSSDFDVIQTNMGLTQIFNFNKNDDPRVAIPNQKLPFAKLEFIEY